MVKKDHNQKPVILELSADEAEFLLRNADVSIRMGLTALNSGMTRETNEKIVGLLELQKAIRKKLIDSGVTNDD